MGHIEELSEALRKLREISPLVHNITNYVVMNSTANALLAIGASPAMAHAVDEVEEMTAISHALVVNIGTLSLPWVEGMRLAIGKALRRKKPWVLDPVGAGATSLRTRISREFLGTSPTVVRGNASEILALATEESGATRGVDSTYGSGAALETARELAKLHGCVVTVSGAVDYVTDGTRMLGVQNGHPMMTRVTGLGCTASALIAAFLVVQPDPLLAAAQAMAVLGIAGEIAAERSPGPGSLQMHLLDVLYGMDAQALSRLRMD